MKLIPDAKTVTTKAHSMWAQYLTLLSLLLPELLYKILERDVVSPRVWWGAALVFCLYGILGRIVDQTDEQGGKRGPLRWLGAVAAMVIVVMLTMGMGEIQIEPETEPAAPVGYEATSIYLVPLVVKWEGKHACANAADLHCSYFDRIASPPLWTVCYGHTETAASGQMYSEVFCRDLLARDLRSYWSEVRQGFTAETIERRLTPQRDAAFSSLGYNVGTYAVRNSTATRRLNAGDIAGACDALTWWNKAGGRVIRGLVNRRTEEHGYCMEGVA